jgi:dGTPase
MVSELYAAYTACPAEMPDDYGAAADQPRSVADYIAGMTDRYAQREHHRLTGRRLFADGGPTAP